MMVNRDGKIVRERESGKSENLSDFSKLSQIETFRKLLQEVRRTARSWFGELRELWKMVEIESGLNVKLSRSFYSTT